MYNIEDKVVYEHELKGINGVATVYENHIIIVINKEAHDKESIKDKLICIIEEGLHRTVTI